MRRAFRQGWRRHGLGVGVAWAIGCLCLPDRVHSQWVVVSLHPAGAINSEARGVSGAGQVGVSDNAINALLWSGSGPSVVQLNPIVGNASMAQSIWGGQQAGTVSVYSPSQGVGFFSHASLWSGTAQSWVDLHPSDPSVIHTSIAATDGVTQVGGYAVAGGGSGFTGGRACLWNGTSGSFVDLNPAGFATSEARGVSGNQQVGGTFDSFLGSACMWTGTAASFVNLNPVEAIASVATCTDGTHQFGVIGVLDPVTGLFPARWSGTAESWELMGIPDPETHWGEIHATHGGIQVGYVTDSDGISNEKACLWTDAPGTFFDLNQFVPSGYVGSNALGVWRHVASGTTYVVGYMVNGSTTQREAVMWVNSPGVNLITSLAAPASCSASVGGSLTYAIRVLNAGPTASGPVTLTVDLPAATVATYQTASPAPDTVTSTQVIFNLAPIAGSGAYTDVSLTLTAVAPGAQAAVTASAATAGESDPTNNTATVASRIQPAPPASALAKGVFSTNTALNNSLIPGGAGRYTAFNRITASPSGGWWTVTATTNQAAAQNTLVVRTQTGGTSTTVIQKGVTAFVHGILQNLSTGVEVNDSGLVAFSGDDAGATTDDGFVATTNGSTVTEIAREASAIPAMAGIAYGSGLGGSINVFANGQCCYSTTSSPAGSNAYLSNNGNAIIAQVSVTTPDGGAGAVKNILQNSTGVWGLSMDGTGAHWIYQADLNTGGTTDDQVIVVDGDVVLQEGVTVLPGMTTPVDGVNKYITMGGGGVWLARGSDTSAREDWVVRGVGTSMTQVYKVGDPLFVGATEVWKEDGVVTSTYFAQAVDGQGNYVIGGFTDLADWYANSVLVYNNAAVIARENDPVDLDGNGVFDDGVYIRSFNADSVALVQGAVLVTVNLRDEDAALCHTNDTDRGQALIRIPLPATGDLNCDGGVNLADLTAFVQALVDPAGYVAAFPNCNIQNADVNHDGSVNGLDVSAYTQCLLNGPCP